jgi:hypothetical protein
MQHVYTGRDELDAHFVKGLLLQQGIVSVVEGGALQETWGGLNLTDKALPSVWVDDADVERARPIIEEYKQRDQADAELEVGNDGERDPIPPRPTWACAHCGEKVEEQFTQCWHCGHPKPAGGAALA